MAATVPSKEVDPPQTTYKLREAVNPGTGIHYSAGWEATGPSVPILTSCHSVKNSGLEAMIEPGGQTFDILLKEKENPGGRAPISVYNAAMAWRPKSMTTRVR